MTAVQFFNTAEAIFVIDVKDFKLGPAIYLLTLKNLKVGKKKKIWGKHITKRYILKYGK